jgi:hypothetical protein
VSESELVKGEWNSQGQWAPVPPPTGHHPHPHNSGGKSSDRPHTHKGHHHNQKHGHPPKYSPGAGSTPGTLTEQQRAESHGGEAYVIGTPNGLTFGEDCGTGYDELHGDEEEGFFEDELVHQHGLEGGTGSDAYRLADGVLIPLSLPHIPADQIIKVRDRGARAL